MSRAGTAGRDATRQRIAPFAPKLTIPNTTASVARPRLTQELVAFAGRTVVVTAPAGYGKTTVATEWAAADPRPFAWLALDRADNDPIVLLTYLAAALDGVESVAPGALDALTGADAMLAELLVTLADVLDRRTEPFVLVLDDVHLLRGPSADAVLPTLAEHIPAGSTLALLTRRTSPVPASRAALRGDALAVSAPELALTDDEVGELLAASGLRPSPASRTKIRHETEGWAAGVYLAALALRDTQDVDAAVDAFEGSDRRVADFFAEEVLPALPADDVDFLLRTAVIERLCGEVANAVLGVDGSGARLERLARENHFVMPLDANGEWYRYHHLFRDMLLSEMRRRDAAACRQAARDASAWFLQQGDPDNAVLHALAGDDREHAARIVWMAAPGMQNVRRVATVERWLARFTDDETIGNPALAATAAWMALTSGDIDRVHRLAAAVELAGDTATLPDGTLPSAAAALLRALITTTSVEVMRSSAAQAYAGHPPTSPYRAIARYLESTACLQLGQVDAARSLATEGIEIGRLMLPPVHAHCLSVIARAAATEGRWPEARRAAEDATAVVREFGFEDRPAMCSVYSIASLTHLEARDTARAETEREAGRRLLERMGDVSPYVAVTVTLELALAAAKVDDVADARGLLDEAERHLRRFRDTGGLPDTFEAVRLALAEAEARRGTDLVEQITPAEVRVLEYLPTHLSFGEIGVELYLSRNTVKTHAMAIYRKLGVTSRSAAVQQARTLRLVPD